MIEIIQAIAGLVLGLFLPGFLIINLILPKLAMIEKVAYGVALTLVIDIIIGIILGFWKGLV